jgi:hypothetical protein
MTARLMLAGEKSVALWMDRYIACRDANEYPPYAQEIVSMDVPSWASEDEDES